MPPLQNSLNLALFSSTCFSHLHFNLYSNFPKCFSSISFLKPVIMLHAVSSFVYRCLSFKNFSFHLRHLAFHISYSFPRFIQRIIFSYTFLRPSSQFQNSQLKPYCSHLYTFCPTLFLHPIWDQSSFFSNFSLFDGALYERSLSSGSTQLHIPYRLKSYSFNNERIPDALVFHDGSTSDTD